MNQNAGQPAVNGNSTATPTSASSTAPVAAPENGTPNTPENKANTNPSTDNTSASGQNQPNQQSQPSQELSDQAKNYLQSQQIDLQKVGIDPNNQIAVDAFIAGHKAMRNANNKQRQEQENSVPTANELGLKQGGVQEQQTDTQTQKSQSFRELDIINVQNILKNEYSDVDPNKLGTKQFYDGMRNLGISPVTVDGDLNLTNIREYAKIVADRERLAKLQSQANKPTNSIPNSNDTVTPIDESAARVDKLDENSAANIIIASQRAMRYGQAVHPQYKQAVEFMQNTTRKN